MPLKANLVQVHFRFPLMSHEEGRGGGGREWENGRKNLHNAGKTIVRNPKKENHVPLWKLYSLLEALVGIDTALPFSEVCNKSGNPIPSTCYPIYILFLRIFIWKLHCSGRRKLNTLTSPSHYLTHSLWLLHDKFRISLRLFLAIQTFYTQRITCLGWHKRTSQSLHNPVVPGSPRSGMYCFNL